MNKLQSGTIDKIAAKMAELTIAGTSTRQQIEILSKEFNCTLNPRKMENYRKREVYQTVLREYTEILVKNSIAELKRETSRLLPKVIRAIEQALDDGNINAVTHALKIIGIDQVDNTQQAQTLTVVLPGGMSDEKKAIEVDEYETDQSERS